ncbi:T9SS type A sorting domain-containing protein [Neolewinella antarctica]|uniref:Secretion system C-terminal sorting domain-containing protein n=1 Tax=Neolewinella antarctica TaxID=442734 RepID=A0ABX0XCF5_9BACT|nr:T9SS type A sorting domain-containing protein [Neolewinella antarctica]NJC26877.1 hypothetical protein [Neolewinella antarctica]
MNRILLTTVVLLFLTLFNTPASAQQVLSQFSWDNSTNPLQADVGPNGVEINQFASVKPRQDGKGNGLAAGADPTKADIDLRLADSSIWDVPGIEVTFDFLRNEDVGNIMRRGLFSFGRAAGAFVSYAVRDGAGGFTQVSSEVYEITRGDSIYHNYLFRYDSETGDGRLFLDGAQVWENPVKTPGQVLYWQGAGDIVIGNQIDDSGLGDAVIDNFSFTQVGATSLPVELTSFEARPDKNQVNLVWQTASETDNDYFTVERSGTNTEWKELTRLNGYGSSDGTKDYQATDANPLPGVNYYRLKQVDYDGQYEYSTIESVLFANETNGELVIYPNPTAGVVNIELGRAGDAAQLFDNYGREVTALAVPVITSDRQLQLDLTTLPVGVYHLRSGDRMERIVKH